MEVGTRKSQVVSATASFSASEQEESEETLVAAREELISILRRHPHIREAFKVPGNASSAAILKALSHTPNKFESLRNAGLTLLEMALQAPEEEQVVQRVGRKSILRIWLSSLCFLELAICGALLWTLETAAGGWSEGTCSISMFTNITCREQTTTRCAVDLEVRGSLDGRLRFYTMQNWYLPVSYKTEMGGNSYAAYLGDRLKCCNEREGEAAGQVGGCCSLMEPTTEIFCDNLQLLGATAFDGTECPGNGWNCLYLNITNFIVPIGIVAAILVVSVLSSAIMICCRKVSDRLPERFHRRSVDYEDAEDALEDMERDGSSKARSAAGSQGSPGQSPRSASSSKRRSKLSKKDLSMPMEVVEEIGDSSPTATVTSGSFRDFSKMSGPSGPSRQQSFMEAPVALSTAVASVPEAVLSLPGVVQELENAAALKKGEAQQRKAVEEECRKYLKWEAHEKPIHTLEEKDIHPDFRNGNLSRYAVMAQQAQSQNAILSPLIEPLPPSTHQPPKLPGSRPGSSRPGTAGRPQSVQAWARPASALSSGRPTSAQRGAKAKRPANAKMPQKPPNLPAKIEIANF